MLIQDIKLINNSVYKQTNFLLVIQNIQPYLITNTEIHVGCVLIIPGFVGGS